MQVQSICTKKTIDLESPSAGLSPHLTEVMFVVPQKRACDVSVRDCILDVWVRMCGVLCDPTSNHRVTQTRAHGHKAQTQTHRRSMRHGPGL